jgi:hypothetical protein
MIIYKDIFTQDELSSDSFPMQLVDDIIFEFKGKHVVRKEGDVVLAGSNPSAEEMEEGTDEAVQRGVDIVLNHQLVEMPVYSSPSVFKDWVKEYVKKLVDHLKKDGMADEELKTFKTKIQGYVSGLLKKERFENLQFFCGAGENASDGQLAIMEYRNMNGEDVPFLMLIKQGLIIEKF